MKEFGRSLQEVVIIVPLRRAERGHPMEHRERYPSPLLSGLCPKSFDSRGIKLVGDPTPNYVVRCTKVPNPLQAPSTPPDAPPPDGPRRVPGSRAVAGD